MTVSRDTRTEQALAFGHTHGWIITHIGGTQADIDRAVARMDAAVSGDDAAYRIASLPENDHETLIDNIATGKTHVRAGSQSPDLIEAVRRLAAAGFSDPSIGVRTHRSTAAVRALRIRHDIAPGRPAGRPGAGLYSRLSGKRRAS